MEYYLSFHWPGAAVCTLILGWITDSGTGASGKKELTWLSFVRFYVQVVSLVGHE